MRVQGMDSWKTLMSLLMAATVVSGAAIMSQDIEDDTVDAAVYGEEPFQHGNSTVHNKTTHNPTTERRTSTFVPVTSTKSVSSTTPKPTSGSGRHFDVGSFFGGIALGAGLVVFGCIGMLIYRRRVQVKYNPVT